MESHYVFLHFPEAVILKVLVPACTPKASMKYIYSGILASESISIHKGTFQISFYKVKKVTVQ